MLQQDRPDDYVIATGEQRSVREFVDAAAAAMRIKLDWEEQGEHEHARVYACDESYPGIQPGDIVVRVDPRYYRPAEVDTLLGDATRAREQLGWSPTCEFTDLVAEMVESDLRLAHEEALVAADRSWPRGF